MDDAPILEPWPPVDCADSILGEDMGPAVVLTPLLPTCRPWGPWATLGWTLLGLFAMTLIQAAVVVAFAVVRAVQGHEVNVSGLATNGNLTFSAFVASTPVVIALFCLLIAARRCPIRDYLALTWPRSRVVFWSTLGLLVLLAATDGLTYVLGRPIVPPVMIAMYQSAWLPLVLLAVIAAAPAMEETIIRGFLFRGIAASRWGPGAAIVLSALVWAGLHIQYDLYGIGTIFVSGLYLGWVRHRASSVPLTMVLHAVANTVATAELLVHLEWLRG